MNESWNYKREEQTFQPIPVGTHRIRVRGAEKAKSKNGRDMLTLQFDVSGHNSTLYYYIVFMPDKPEVTNRMLTSFFDSFKDIPDGEFDMSKWIGKVGACVVKHEDYNGNPSAKIHYFIKADKQDELPPWKEPAPTGEKPATTVSAALTDEEISELLF
jgi:hypothetical protein